MKHAKVLLSLFAFGILVGSNCNFRTVQATNAWQSSYESRLAANGLESTFISLETDQNGLNHYKYHVKNISKFYIYDFCINGLRKVSGENYELNQSDRAKVENDLFNYKTLLIGPNQETDVDFCVQEKYSNIEQVSITAYGYDVSGNGEIATDVSLENNYLTLSDSTVHLSIENNDKNYDYYAICKANIDSNDYYFVVSSENEYKAYGNFASRSNENISIELVKTIKFRHNNQAGYDENGNNSSSGAAVVNFMLAILSATLFVPALIGIGISVLIAVIIIVAVCFGLKKRRRQNNNNNN